MQPERIRAYLRDVQQFDSIDQIKEHTFAGCYLFDGAAFRGIEKFVLDTSHSIADRAEALRIMSDKGMGCGRDEDFSDEALVQAFMDEYAEAFSDFEHANPPT